MKHYKRANIYKASNVTFSPETYQAYSYDWWRFVDRINGKTVFNNYYYSSSTVKHLYKVRRLLGDLNIDIDLIVECPNGLQQFNWKEDCINYYQGKIKELQDAINKPRSRKSTNEERQQNINLYLEKIKQVNEV